MRKFIQKALDRIDKLDKDQIYHLISDISIKNELYEVVLDSMTDGVIVVNDKFRLLFNNKYSERLIPIQFDENNEKPIWELISDLDIARFIKNVLEKSDRVIDAEFALDLKGKSRLISITSMPLVKAGVIQGSLFHIEDITEKKENFIKLKRAENLASLTTLAAGVAHEIKNPLGSISIHIQLLQKEFARKKEIDKENALNYLKVIDEEVERLNSIVVDFLFSVRPIDIKSKKTDLNMILNDFIDFVKYEVEKAGIKIKADLMQNIPLIELDDKYIKQALLNIIKNSISAMKNGGEILIKTRAEGDKVILIIKDTGKGIPDKIKDKIFEPYFTTKDFGSGLGLTMVYKIIKEHSAEIAVNSKEGKGTEVMISFPVPVEGRKLLQWRENE